MRGKRDEGCAGEEKRAAGRGSCSWGMGRLPQAFLGSLLRLSYGRLARIVSQASAQIAVEAGRAAITRAARLAISRRFRHIDAESRHSGSEPWQARLIPFRKMNGLGNEFAVFDGRDAPGAARRRRRSARSAQPDAIGFDQMITLERSHGRRRRLHAHPQPRRRRGRCLRQRHALRRLAGDGRERPEDRHDRDQCRAACAPSTPASRRRSRSTWASRASAGTRSRLPSRSAIPAPSNLQIGPIDAPILHSPSAVSMGNPHAIFWVDDVEALRPRPLRADPREPPDLPGARQYLARPCHGARRDHGEDLGARRRAHQGLRHGRLRRRGRRDAQEAHRPRASP